MNTLIFIIIAVVLVAATLYFSLKSKVRCPSCRSINIDLTGNIKYKEDPPLAFVGSPDSYNELEYKCNNCGQLSWKKQKAVIFN